MVVDVWSLPALSLIDRFVSTPGFSSPRFLDGGEQLVRDFSGDNYFLSACHVAVGDVPQPATRCVGTTARLYSCKLVLLSVGSISAMKSVLRRFHEGRWVWVVGAGGRGGGQAGGSVRGPPPPCEYRSLLPGTPRQSLVPPTTGGVWPLKNTCK